MTFGEEFESHDFELAALQDKWKRVLDGLNYDDLDLGLTTEEEFNQWIRNQVKLSILDQLNQAISRLSQPTTAGGPHPDLARAQKFKQQITNEIAALRQRYFRGGEAIASKPESTATVEDEDYETELHQTLIDSQEFFRDHPDQIMEEHRGFATFRDYLENEIREAEIAVKAWSITANRSLMRLSEKLKKSPDIQGLRQLLTEVKTRIEQNEEMAAEDQFQEFFINDPELAAAKNTAETNLATISGLPDHVSFLVSVVQHQSIISSFSNTLPMGSRTEQLVKDKFESLSAQLAAVAAEVENKIKTLTVANLREALTNGYDAVRDQANQMVGRATNPDQKAQAHRANSQNIVDNIQDLQRAKTGDKVVLSSWIESQIPDHFKGTIPTAQVSEAFKREAEQAIDQAIQQLNQLRTNENNKYLEVKAQKLIDALDWTEAVVRRKYDFYYQGRKLTTSDLLQYREAIARNLQTSLPPFLNSGENFPLAQTLKERSEKALKNLDTYLEAIRMPEKALARMEEIWAQFVEQEQTTKQLQASSLVYDRSDVKSINRMSIFAMIEEFFDNDPQLHKEWTLKIAHLNAFNIAANSDIFKILAWADADSSRDKAKGQINVAELRGLTNLPRLKEVAEAYEEILEHTQTYIGPNGTELTWDFAKNGNPTQTQIEEFGYKSITTLVEEKAREKLARQGKWPANKPLPRSDIDAVIFNEIITEKRLHEFIEYYANYLKSPDGITFDVKPIKDHAPTASILYTLRAKGNLIPDLRIFWLIHRLPGKNWKFTVPGKHRLQKGNQPATEYLPEIDKDKKDRNKAGQGNQNVIDAILARELVLKASTLEPEKGYRALTLPDNLILIPTFWQLVHEKDASGNYKWLTGEVGGAFTYSNYTDSINAWRALYAQAQNPVEIQRPDQVDDAVAELVNKISAVKPLLGILGNTPEGLLLSQTIEEMCMHYLKYIFDKFMKISLVGTKEKAKRGVLFKRTIFFDIVIREFEAKETLPKEIREFIVDKMKFYREHGFTYNLFSVKKPSTQPSIWEILVDGESVAEQEAIVVKVFKAAKEEKTAGKH